MAFYVGQKVARVSGIDNGRGRPCPPLHAPAHVSWVGVHAVTGDEVIDLVEYPAPETVIFLRGYNAHHFRPIISRPTDISIFTAMLGPKQKETLDV